MPRFGTHLKYECCGKLAFVDFDHKPTVDEIARHQKGPCGFCAANAAADTGPKLALDIEEPEANDDAPVDAGCPALIGSTKQLAWALSIRRDLLGKLDRHFRDWGDVISRSRDEERAERGRENRKAALAVMERIRAQPRAWVWIEWKDLSAAEMLKRAVEPKAEEAA